MENQFYHRPANELRVIFWRSAGYLIEQALHRKELIHRCIRYTPVIAWGGFAFILGSFVGDALLKILY